MNHRARPTSVVDRARWVVASSLAAITCVLSGCTKPLPEESDVPDALFFEYPGARRAGGWEHADAVNDPNLDGGGDFSPLWISGSYELDEPIAVGNLFEWFLENAGPAGLDGCGVVAPRQLDPSTDFYARAGCPTKRLTGFDGSVEVRVDSVGPFTLESCIDSYTLEISIGPGVVPNSEGLESEPPSGAVRSACTDPPLVSPDVGAEVDGG